MSLTQSRLQIACNGQNLMSVGQTAIAVIKFFRTLARVENPELVHSILDSGILNATQKLFFESRYNSVLHNTYCELVRNILDQDDPTTLWAVGSAAHKVYQGCKVGFPLQGSADAPEDPQGPDSEDRETGQPIPALHPVRS